MSSNPRKARISNTGVYYSLWGSAAKQQPSADFQRDEEAIAVGWQLIASVNTRNLGYGGVHASSVSATKDVMDESDVLPVTLSDDVTTITN